MHKKKANALIHETSPYLLQHAHNPVDWQSWSQELLDKAKHENKLLIISIGYSTCHWCHVMEHESFEDPSVAELMNWHYTPIKIDREERPDIDRHYMDAVQLITGTGGWPLNVVTLPDGRPVWGGTYFKKEQWVQALAQIQELFQNQPDTLYTYAAQLEKGLRAIHVVDVNNTPTAIDDFDVNAMLQQWTPAFDMEKGGLKGAPKFMMPGHLAFLLQESVYSNNEQLRQYVMTTLTQMAYGGIFDQVNGGFSRYSIDERWHVPHFEKMLYDNAQLVSLYCDAYLVSKNPLLKETVFETLHFIEKELTDREGVFFTALDADSLDSYGVLKEGAYYTFTKEELQEIVGDDFELFSTYYNINDYGKWEDEYVLIRTKPDAEIARQFSIDIAVLQQKKHIWKEQLRKHRTNKTRPRLDNKVLTSWNALMIKAYTDAYRVFGERDFLDIALKAAHFIKDNQQQPDGTLFRNFTHGKRNIPGCLDDYVFLVDAYLALYENTFDEKWLIQAKKLTDYTIEHFYDAGSGMFFYTSDQSEQLLNRTVEYHDNVMSASNSVQAHNLFKLGRLFVNNKYNNMTEQMLKNVLPEIHRAPAAYGHWLQLLRFFQKGFYEIAITGAKAFGKTVELQQHYIPNKVVAGSTNAQNSLQILQGRFADDKTVIYVCRNNTCQLPVTETENALKLIHE